MNIIPNKLNEIRSDELLNSYFENGYTLFENAISKNEQKHYFG